MSPKERRKTKKKMKNRKMKFKKRHQELELEVIEQDLRQEQKVDGTAMTVIHTTGCISVDVALGSCYKWIAEEKGIMINYDKIII